MSLSAPSDDHEVDRQVVMRRVDAWLLVSAVCLYLETRLIDFGPEGSGAAGGYLLVGVVLLLLVRRGSGLARGLVVVMASTGAVIYALTSTSLLGGLVALLFAGEAGALLTPAIRDHVHSSRRCREPLVDRPDAAAG